VVLNEAGFSGMGCQLSELIQGLPVVNNLFNTRNPDV